MDYYPTISAQETKQTNKQNNLLSLTVSCEKRSCSVRSKEKQNKSKNKKKIEITKTEKTKEKRIQNW